MLWIAIGIYTIFAVLIFAFFIVAKVHVYKFRDYSVQVEPVTKTLGIVLMLLILIGYYLIWHAGSSPAPTTQSVKNAATTEIY